MYEWHERHRSNEDGWLRTDAWLTRVTFNDQRRRSETLVLTQRNSIPKAPFAQITSEAKSIGMSRASVFANLGRGSGVLASAGGR